MLILSIYIGITGNTRKFEIDLVLKPIGGNANEITVQMQIEPFFYESRSILKLEPEIGQTGKEVKIIAVCK